MSCRSTACSTARRRTRRSGRRLPGRRKIVLATAIAETSITIDGVRVVIDSGLSRLPRYEPATGLTRLETVRVSRASADQRAGRAGRTQPGVAIRLWRAEQTAALPAFTPPEILEADLSGLMLDCAAFGVADPATLRFLDPPPGPALQEARALLVDLDAIDEDGRLTSAGEAMRRLALPVRLAHMVAVAAGQGLQRQAALLAVLLTERGLGGDSTDLERRLSRFAADRSPRANAARQLAGRLAMAAAPKGGSRQSAADEGRAPAPCCSRPGRTALPGRVASVAASCSPMAAVRSSMPPTRWPARHFSSSPTCRARRRTRGSRPRPQSPSRRSVPCFRTASKRRTESAFDAERRAVRVRETVRLGAITLSERMLPAPSGPEADAAILAAVRQHGLSLLPWNKETETLRHRLQFLHRGLGAPWPDLSDAALVERLDEWLLPYLGGEASFARIDAGALRSGLMSLVPYDLQRSIASLAPTHFDAPSGSHVPIRYDGEQPVLAVRVQELFGLDRHPSIANGTVPLMLELLSPAHRPIQTTRDLPGFWRGSWADVRADMRGRYPKHVWPENPLAAAATSRAKPRAK